MLRWKKITPSIGSIEFDVVVIVVLACTGVLSSVSRLMMQINTIGGRERERERERERGRER